LLGFSSQSSTNTRKLGCSCSKWSLTDATTVSLRWPVQMLDGERKREWGKFKCLCACSAPRGAIATVRCIGYGLNRSEPTQSSCRTWVTDKHVPCPRACCTRCNSHVTAGSAMQVGNGISHSRTQLSRQIAGRPSTAGTPCWRACFRLWLRYSDVRKYHNSHFHPQQITHRRLAIRGTTTFWRTSLPAKSWCSGSPGKNTLGN
jgi:hypothetical protein